MPRIMSALVRRRGTATDDLMIRVTGALAAVALVAAFIVPAVAQLAPFALYTIWTNGPHSPVLNGAYEPVLMLYGRFFPPLLVAVVGTASTVFVEWINYHLYARAGETNVVRKLRDSRWLTSLTAWYRRRPFSVILFCALGPVPFWVARMLSALSGYSVPRHLAATALGRFPRLWLIAAIGQPLGIPTSWLVGLAAGSLVLAAAVWSFTRLRRSRPRPAVSRDYRPSDARMPTHLSPRSQLTVGAIPGTAAGAS